MKKHLQCLLLLLFIAFQAIGQERIVTGTVTDKSDGLPLPGVSILVKGTTVGTQTSGTGTYSIRVPEGKNQLEFAFVGYVKQTVNIGGSKSINVSLVSDQQQLGEVVVMGYGTQSKKDVTGSVVSVSGDKLKNQPVQSFEQALAGKAAGVNIIMPNGVLNNPPVFRIRGFNSISLSSYPLIVVDGIPVYTGDASGTNAAGNALGDINPSDIESIDILKDAAASAIYGSRASNGVVVITTKKGKQGSTKVNYEAWAGFNEAANLPELLDAQGYVTMKNEALANIGTPARFFLQTLADGSTVNTDWYKVAYRTGVSQNHSLNFSGATDKTSYYVSVGFSDQEGFIRNNDFQRKIGRVNLDHKLTKRVKVGSNFSFTNTYNKAPNTGSLSGQAFNTGGLGRLAIVLPPNVPAYNPDGTYHMNGGAIGFGANNSAVASNYPNAQVLLNEDKFTSENNRLIGNVYASVDLLKGMVLKTSYGMDNLLTENISFANKFQGDGFSPNGSATNTYSRNNRWNWVNTLNYNTTIASSHNISALAGYEEQSSIGSAWGAQRQNVSDPFIEVYQGGFGTITPSGNGLGINAFRSVFGSANYDFKKKYFLAGSFRRDGYSGLAAGQKWGNFGGASVGWDISQENFFKTSKLADIMSQFKLRGSYGVVGNINIGDFPALSLYGTGLYGGVPSLGYSQAGNSELKWETSTKTDIGINMAFLNGRIEVDADYFYNDIDKLVQAAPQSPSKGIPGNSITTNIGRMYNRGWEFTINSTNIEKGNFRWSSNFNISFIKNEVTSLANNNSDLPGASGLETANRTRVGYSLGQIYVVETAGVDPATGERIFVNRNGQNVRFSFQRPAASRYLFLDGANAGQVAPAIDAVADARIWGNSIPTFYGGFDNNFKFKEFDLNLGITYSGGNYLYYGTQAGLRDQRFWNNEAGMLRRWTTAGQVTDIPRVVYGDNTSNGSAVPMSANVYKGDFLKLRNVSLGYTLPAKYLGKTGMSNVRVYAQATNLLVFTNYAGADPEVSINGNSNLAPGVDRNSVPLGRTITFGLNVGF
jgi:TonB-linked SusC/RagA family outer membrane protein